MNRTGQYTNYMTSKNILVYTKKQMPKTFSIDKLKIELHMRTHHQTKPILHIATSKEYLRQHSFVLFIGVTVHINFN